MSSILPRIALAACTLLCLTAQASKQASPSPEASSRSDAQNYKDMVLASCLAQAYRNDGGAAIDAGSSVTALRDWTYYDMERSPDAVKALVDRYLARDYANPLAEAKIKGVRFDLLKCMDLYHSQALDDLARRLVLRPQRSLKQDKISPAASGKGG